MSPRNTKLQQLIEQMFNDPKVRDEIDEMLERAREAMQNSDSHLVFYAPARELTADEQAYIAAHEEMHANYSLMLMISPSNMVH